MPNLVDFNTNSEKMLKHIRACKKKINYINKELKKHFVGLDSIIDNITRHVEPWYIMPELLNRPTIICLWGMTGVGKTDLVRRLVKLMGYSGKFCEIEMGSKVSWNNTVAGILSQNPNIRSGVPSIILLDEIQNFRTINEDGHELADVRYRDVWTLLSDGKLPFSVDLEFLFSLLWEYNKKPEVVPTPVLTPIGDDLEDQQEMIDLVKHAIKPGNFEPTETVDNSYQSLQYFKKALRLTEPLEEIATWSNNQKRSVILAKINNDILYEEEDYTKCLIFVSGNLDETFAFSKMTDEVDVDADIFHNLSKKITILDVKKSLCNRFKPEQIARFGNIHCIYPSLSKNSYRTIIKRKIIEKVSTLKERWNIHVNIDDSINKLIYDNGVFPIQGTRPVFSTLSSILDSPMPLFVMNMCLQKKNTFDVLYDGKNICAKIEDKIIKFPYEGDIDKLKLYKFNNVDRKTMAAVHEAGHALVSILLLNRVPLQINASPASIHNEGYIHTKEVFESVQLCKSRIKVLLAGAEAEKIIFGYGSRSLGGTSDLGMATSDATLMVRKSGVDKYASYVSEPTKGDMYNNDIEGTNGLIEKIIKDCGADAHGLLTANISVFIKMVDELLLRGEMQEEEIKKFCKENNLALVKDKNDDHVMGEEEIYEKYEELYKKFKEKNN